MRFAVFSCAPDGGRIFALHYRQPMIGSPWLRKAREECPGWPPNGGGWLWFDYRAALLAYQHHSRSAAFDASACVALAFVGPDGTCAILEHSRADRDGIRDCMADALERISKRDTSPAAVAAGDRLKQLAPKSAPRPSLLASFSPELARQIETALGERNGKPE